MQRTDTRLEASGGGGAAAGTGGGFGGRPKMVIKPFKSQPKLPADFEQRTWQTLQAAVQAVFLHKAAAQSKEELYRAVEDMCMHKLAANLYNNLHRECEVYVNQHIDTLVALGKCSDGAMFLNAVDAVWREHCEQIVTIRNIFLYLDRTYCVASGGSSSGSSGGTAGLQSSQQQQQLHASNAVLPIWDFGLALFNKRLEARSAEIETKLIVGLLSVVEADRKRMSTDKEVIKRLLRMLVSLGQYHQKFQVPFLLDTERFFQAEGQVMIERSDPAEFLMHVENRLTEALEMSRSYLDPATRWPLQQVIESKLLVPHVPLLVEKGLGPLLDQLPHRISDLRRMCQLMDRVNATELLKQGWANHMRNIGENLISDSCEGVSIAGETNTGREKTLIEDLLAFHEKMEMVLKVAFNGQEAFRSVLKSSFEYFINLKQSRPAELLARFVDKKMKGEKGLVDTETDAQLEKALSIFRFLQAKDVFEAFYKKLLSKRLLLRKSSDLELEKSMITKLKTECGSNYTSKLEGMFQDVDMSKEVMLKYTNHISRGALLAAAPAPDRVQADFQVLTTGYWPFASQTDSARLPPDLISCRDRFTSFYNEKYQGRRLQFVHSLERCIVMAHFPIKKKELEVSLYQALVLMGFNRSSRLTVEDIQALTGVEDGELRRTLQSLANGVIGTRVLVKEPKGKEVGLERGRPIEILRSLHPPSPPVPVPDTHTHTHTPGQRWRRVQLQRKIRKQAVSHQNQLDSSPRDSRGRRTHPRGSFS